MKKYLLFFLDDASYELIKLFSLITNVLLEALTLSCGYQLQHKWANINSHHRASLDPMTHTGFGDSRLNKDKNVLITWILVIPSV